MGCIRGSDPCALFSVDITSVFLSPVNLDQVNGEGSMGISLFFPGCSGATHAPYSVLVSLSDEAFSRADKVPSTDVLMEATPPPLPFFPVWHPLK